MLKSHNNSPFTVDELLAHSQRTIRFRNLLFIFWGLIVGKCFLLQWAIFHYSVPVNGWLFVWAPSLLFGILCMFVYARSTLGGQIQAPLTTRLMRAQWIACGAAFIIFLAESVLLGQFSPYLLPGILAVLLGIGYFIQGVAVSRVIFQQIGIAWWICAIPLLALRNEDALAWMALFIICLQVIPSGILYFKNHPSGTA